jgi:hypothetical protein
MQHNAYDTQEYPHLSVGTWVHATTVDGHRVVGYIEKLENIDKTGMIVVTHACCDRVGVIGWADMKNMEVLPDTELGTCEGYLMNAIDFALDTGDQESFMKLSDELRKLVHANKMRKPIVAVVRLM